MLSLYIYFFYINVLTSEEIQQELCYVFGIIVLHPMCGIFEENQFSIITMIHADTCHAVTERRVLHAPD